MKLLRVLLVDVNEKVVETLNQGKIHIEEPGIGEIIKKAVEKGITEVVFDRGGYIYHGRIKELAEGAREAGLKF